MDERGGGWMRKEVGKGGWMSEEVGEGVRG